VREREIEWEIFNALHMGHKEEPSTYPHKRDGGSITVCKFSYITLWSLMSHVTVNEWRSAAFDQGLPNTLAKLIIIKKNP